MASIQERQQLADTLRQIGQDNAYVHQAQAFKSHLEQLPDVATFSPDQVRLHPAFDALTTLEDCTALVRLPDTDGRKQTLDDWHDLLDAYFHDERQPTEPLPQMEAAFDLATELIERDAIAKAVRRNHEERQRLLEEVPRVEAEHDARMASHKGEVTRKLAELSARKDSLYEELRAARDKVARIGRFRRIIPANGPGYSIGCLVLTLLLGLAFHFTRNLTLSFCLVGLLVLLPRRPPGLWHREARRPKEQRHTEQGQAPERDAQPRDRGVRAQG